MSGFLHLLASSGVLVFLTTTTTTLVQHADGASSATGDDLAVTCATELAACVEADTCVSCSSVLVDSSSSVVACSAAQGFVSSESSTATCDDINIVACCVDEASDGSCLDNGAFVDYLLCVTEAQSCFEDEITCEDAVVADSASSATATGVDIAVTCATEIAACRVADTCVSCISAIADSSSSVVACSAAQGFVATSESSSPSCDDINIVACCLDEAFNGDCRDNDAFVDYWLCVAEAQGCFEDEITCDDIENAGGAADNGSTIVAGVGIASTAAIVGLSCASMTVLQLL